MASVPSRLLLLAALATAPAAAAERLPAAPDLTAAGWEVHVFAGDGADRFRPGPDGVIEVRSRDSAAFLVRALPATAGPGLSWRWRVDESPPPSDLARAGADDRPLALHVVFPRPDSDRGLFDAIGEVLVSAFVGAPFTGRFLSYCWGGLGARGDRLDNPHLDGEGTMVVLRPGDTPHGRWFRERVDLAADYRRAFGTEAPPPAYIALSADTDDSGGVSRGAVADIVFGAP